MGKFKDDDYIIYDPFFGDRDVEIKCQKVNIVTTRKQHECIFERTHIIETGTRARYETALVDGEWGSYYMCLDCMDEFMINHLGMEPNNLTPSPHREGL